MEKMNLFFIHTPFQLFVVNQIISYKKLTHNIAVFGFVNNNRHFYDIYEKMVIGGFFDKVIYFDDLERWAQVTLHNPISSIVKVRRNLIFLQKIVEENNISTLYLGDINNQSCRFSSILFSKKGLKIVFYEEGSSHYSYEKKIFKFSSFAQQMLSRFYDLVLYKKILGAGFGKYLFSTDLPKEKLHIDKRYSFLDVFHEPYDEVIPVRKIQSDKIKNIVKTDLANIENIVGKNEVVLFISSPIYGDLGEVAYNVFCEYLERIISTIHNTIFVVKFHPRDTRKFQDFLLHVFEKNNIEYVVLASNINIPLEYYLQSVSFTRMLTFMSSVSFYNGVIYPRTQIEDLALDYFLKCKELGIPHSENFVELCRKLLALKNNCL